MTEEADLQKSAASKVDVGIELAKTRTVLAFDRTLLAWVRTSLTLIGFGFTLAKFVHLLATQGTLKGVTPDYARHVGIAIMILGIVSLIAGVVDYLLAIKHLRSKLETKITPWSSSMAIALILALLTIFLIANLSSELI